jgi:hypothetical protein
MTRRRIRYGYQMCPMLESRFWGVVGLRCDYPSEIARIVLERLCADYLRYRRTGSVTDKLAAWRALRRCQGWFEQLGGNRYGLS